MENRQEFSKTEKCSILGQAASPASKRRLDPKSFMLSILRDTNGPIPYEILKVNVNTNCEDYCDKPDWKIKKTFQHLQTEISSFHSLTIQDHMLVYQRMRKIEKLEWY